MLGILYREQALQSFGATIQPLSIPGLILTVVLLFGFQAPRILPDHSCRRHPEGGKGLWQWPFRIWTVASRYTALIAEPFVAGVLVKELFPDIGLADG